MATATKPKKTPSQASPTPQVPPPANETRVLPDGTIQRFKDGQLVKTTPPPKANGQATPKPAVAVAKGNPSKAAPPKPSTAEPRPPQPPASLQAAVQATGNPEQFIAKLNTEDIWGFRCIDPTGPSQGVMVTHYRGYDIVRQHRRSEPFANKLWHDMLKAGLTWIDGVIHRLVDEEA